MSRQKSLPYVLFFVSFFTLFPQLCLTQARCDKLNTCATGCCSQAGFCGTGDEFCGEGCQSTCDYKAQCDEKNPCPDGTCCSKSGYCGFGPDRELQLAPKIHSLEMLTNFHQTVTPKSVLVIAPQRVNVIRVLDMNGRMQLSVL